MNTTTITSIPLSNEVPRCHTLDALSDTLLATGLILSRFSLVVIIGWVGGMKFTRYEAQGISGLVQNSPFMSWMYNYLSIQGFSNALGVLEVTVAFGLALGAFFPRVGVVAGLLAVSMFLGTLSFMFSTPGTFEPTLGGFPALSADVGQFLIKDLGLLAGSVVVTAISLKRSLAD